MSKISIRQFNKLMGYDVSAHHECIEISFCIDGSLEYHSCWLGKTPCRETGRALYWFGLVNDGSQAYDYEQYEDMIHAPVFSGKSLLEIWDKVTLCSIDGMSVESRLPYYSEG